MATATSWRDLLHRPHALSTAVVALGVLTPAFSWFVTNTVLPSAVADIGGLTFYAWVPTGYSVGSILGTAGAAFSARRAGTRATLVGASLVFALGALGCAAAPAMPALVGARVLQGIAGGVMIAAVHGLMRREFPEALWPRVLAAISAAWGVAATTGPAVGGLLAGGGHWRAAFASMLPLAALGAVLTAWLLAPAAPVRDARQAAGALPVGRLALTSASVFCVAAVGNTTGTARRLALVAAAVGLMALVLRLERGAAARLFPADVLSLRRPMGRAVFVVFCLAMSTTPVSVFLPFFLQVLHGASPAVAGYLTAAQSLAWTTGALLGARLAGGGARRAVALGPLAVGAGFAALGAAVPAGPLPAVGAAVLLVGGGIGAAWAHVGSMVLGAARRGEEDVAASLIPSTQTMAVALGAAVSGVIANAAGLAADASPAVMASAARALFGAFVAVPLAAAVVAARLRVPARAAAA